MAKIIAITSFRRGVGRSNLTANLAVLLTVAGRRVCMVDTTLQSPSLHVLFQIDETEVNHVLNDYLAGQCDIEQTVYNITNRLNINSQGQLYIVPASVKIPEMTRMVRAGYEPKLLHNGFQQLTQSLNLDALIIDTQHGLNQETLSLIALADALLVLMHTDQQHYRGTDTTVQIARKLNVPHLMLLVNEVPAMFDLAAVQAEVSQAYDCEVVAALPYLDEVMSLASADIFVLRHPDHPFTQKLTQVAHQLMA